MESQVQQILSANLSGLDDPALAQIQDAFKKLRKQPIGPMLLKYASAAEGVAERLNKPIQTVIEGKQTLVHYEEKLETFFGALGEGTTFDITIPIA